jgi:hypothetical protein
MHAAGDRGLTLYVSQPVPGGRPASGLRHQALRDFLDYGQCRAALLLRRACETDRPVGRSKLTWARTSSS